MEFTAKDNETVFQVGAILYRKTFHIFYHCGVIYKSGDKNTCRVVHILPNGWDFNSFKVVSSSLDEFLDGRDKFWYKFNPTINQEEVQIRINNLLGKNFAFSSKHNNCEHLSNWFVYKRPVSLQSMSGLFNLIFKIKHHDIINKDLESIPITDQENYLQKYYQQLQL